jgi:hypothetical protein
MFVPEAQPMESTVQQDKARVAGWLILDKGNRYLSNDRGTISLTSADTGRPWWRGLGTMCAVVVAGQWQDETTFQVDEVVTARPGAGQRRPRFVATPAANLYTISRARLAVDTLLHDRGLAQIFLPTIWRPSSEYGEEEIAVAHSLWSSDERPVLLQSPEFPMYAALTEGISAFYSWGRCYRYEQEATTQHLMEFEQVDIGLSFSDLAEMMALTEDIVRLVAAELGVALGDFQTRSPADADTSVDASVLTFPASMPSTAFAVIGKRLEVLGVEWTDLSVAGSDTVRWALAGGEHTDVAHVVDTVEALVTSVLGYRRPDLNPTWRTPLPRAWEDEGQFSSYAIRGITSKRVDGSADLIEEAELYLAGVEVAHAGVFASGPEFDQNIADAQVPGLADRYAWLRPTMDNAPPGLTKVGIGWERLVSTLLGLDSPALAQPFPRMSDGTLLYG